MKNTILFLGLFFFIIGCASEQASFKEAHTEQSLDSYEQTEKQASTDKLEVVERKIIRTADMRFQVEDLKASTQHIETAAKDAGGFIANSNQSSSNYSINNTIIVRIPSKQFDDFLARVEQEAIYVNSKNINANDVTEEYVDITTRLATKKEVRDRYIEILRDKAQNVTEILNAEEKIRVLQEEIEAAEGRLKFLSNRTDLSTITMHLYQKTTYASAPKLYERGYFSRLKEGFWTGWEMIQALSIGAVTIWPLWLILIGLFFLRKRFWKKKRNT